MYFPLKITFEKYFIPNFIFIEIDSTSKSNLCKVNRFYIIFNTH